MLAKKLIIVISALAVSGCDASHQSEWGGSDDSTISPPFKKLISPSYIKIFKYYIDLDVFFDDSEAPMYYTGEVEILFGFRSKIKTIDIHGTSFTELHSKLFSPDTNEEHTLNYTVSDADDKIILELPSKIDLKYNVPYHLKFTYRQSIGKKFMGLFYTTYNGVNEIPVGYVATQMQPAFARRVFPCFDEPSLKATFAISITHNSKYTAISNELEYSRAPVNSTPQSMPLTSENRTKTTFQITQKMSTYNVAFVISDFQNLNATDSNEVLHRVFYNNASKYDMHEQLKNSIRTVKYLNDYFDVDYPLAKLDQFPLDIQNVGPSVTGAVENWGLIFYNRHHMIQKNQISTEEYIYETHEIIHQWIGNLITLDDWSEYWINEGLTTYISYMVGNILYPKWNISRHFIDEINTNVFGDWGNAVVPTPAQPESGSDGFDVDVMAISDFSRPEIYTKAAAILKMFDEALGFGIVKEAIQELLREYSHSTINTKTFGQKMHWLIKKTNQTIFHHENMPLILKEWLTNHGTPKIFVNRNYYNDTISFTIKTHDKRASSLQQQPWTIPINFAIGSDPNFNNTGASFVLHSYGDNILQHSQIGLNNISTDEWLILNKQQSGLYSVVYDDYNTKLIVKALISNHTQIHPINRALLFRDFRLNINDITDIASIVDAFTYITNEDDLYAVAEASGAMLDILIKFRGSLLYDKLKGFLLKYSWRFFDKFYTRQPTHLQKDIIIEYLTEIDSPRLLRYVQQRLPNAEVLTNKSMYPLNDVSDMLTCVFFAHMDPNTFSRILWWLQNVEDEQSFVDISYLIPCVRREDLINKFLDVFFDETIKFGVEQTVNSKLRYIAHMFKRSYNARPLILDVLLQKYKLLFTERPLAESILTKIMPYVSSRDKMKFIKLLSNVKNLYANKRTHIFGTIGSSVGDDEAFAQKQWSVLWLYLKNKNTNLDQEKDTYDEEDSGEQTDTVNDATVSITTDTTVISSPYKPTITMSTIITGSSTTNSVDQSPTSEEASSPTPHSRAADIIDSTTTDINRSWAEGAYIYPPPPDQFDYYWPLITYTFLAICVLGVCLIIRVCRYSGRFRISNGRTRNNTTTNNENSNNGKPNNTDYITVYTSMEETPKCVY